ncbi:MAG: Ig-like domain-containing protein [Vicinamibacterales bacterium]
MTARVANGSMTVTAESKWQSSDPGVMTVSATGLATALAGGSVTLSATYQGGTGSLTLTSSRLKSVSRTTRRISRWVRSQPTGY